MIKELDRPLGTPERSPFPVVLCVDDDPSILSALRRALRGEPYDVVTASNAAQALAALRSYPVVVVLADERMPDLYGSELLAEVRERWPSIGRVILTGFPGHSVMIRGFRAGVDHLFHKPWDDASLKRTVRQMIAKGGSS